MISLHAMDKELLLVNVYGPNRDENLVKIIKLYHNHNVIALGDWNLILDSYLDYFNYYKHTNNPKARERVEHMIEELGLADIWREDNLECKCYTW